MLQKLKGFVESIAVASILIFVLLPVRVVFVRYVSDDWLGSFGLITLISVIIIILAKKNKLGWFGRAFHRQMWKIHRGKRKYLFYGQIIIGGLFFATAVYAIELGNAQYSEQKERLSNLLQIENMEQLAEQTQDDIDLTDIPKGMFALVYVIFFRFDIYAVLMSTLDDISDGYVLHLSTVFLVEEIELIAIAIITKYWIKTEKSDDAF